MTSPNGPSRHIVLVVDDTPDNLTVLSDLLKDDYKVKLANGGAKALKLAAALPQPDLILLDLMMPEMDGYEVMRRIREIPSFRTLPIIALTAKAMKGDREKCLQAGASDYVAKPVNTEQLLSLVRMWLQP
jgi:putative two-component system response regulator